MGGGTLKNRSSRFGTPSASSSSGSSINGIRSKAVPLRRPHDGASNDYRAAYSADNGDDNMTVKSNPSGPPPSRYVLPCFRFRSKKSAALATLATAAIFVSICSAFIAYKSLSSISSHSSGHYFLPSAKEWGRDRERRKKARRGRREYSSNTDDRYVKAVKYTEYETHLLDVLFSLRAAAVKTSMIPLRNNDPLGQDMSIYTNLGCSVFNELNSNFNTQNSTTFHKERIRQLWSSHLSTILQASRHADDSSYMHKNWTATLLKSLSPYSILDHLPNGNTVHIMSAKDIDRIIGIIVRRFLGILHHKGKSTANLPPPLRIAVFGGPTVEGKGCHRARVGLPRGSIMANPAFCAFPYRLEQFLNAILLPPPVLNQLRRTLDAANPTAASANEIRLVEVINLGEEGTNTEYSQHAIVRNRMYPPLMNAQYTSSTGYGGGPPDLVIDAYGIDDYGKGGATAELHEFYDEVINPSFYRYPRGCFAENRKRPPVVVRAVLEEDTSSSQLQFASSTMTAILGDAVDDVEEGEMSLPDIENPENKESEAGGAFGMAGHIASSWTLSFNLAYAAISHCGSVQYQPPKKRRNTIPNAATARCDNGVDPPCLFSFLAGPKGTAPRPSAIASNLMPYIVENTGWQPESDMTTGFARKTGLVGTGEGATMTLLFRNITRPVRRLDVITLRSTSEAWKDGVAQISLVTGGDFSHGSEAAEESSRIAKESSFEISAELIAEDRVVGKDRHISYHFGLDLDEGENEGQVGTDVLLRMILTKGSRFKILGLMLCE